MDILELIIAAMFDSGLSYLLSAIIIWVFVTSLSMWFFIKIKKDTDLKELSLACSMCSVCFAIAWPVSIPVAVVCFVLVIAVPHVVHKIAISLTR